MKLMILDEPTSSLPIERTEQLQEYLCKTAGEGMTYLYFSPPERDYDDCQLRVYHAKRQ